MNENVNSEPMYDERWTMNGEQWTKKKLKSTQKITKSLANACLIMGP